MSTTLAKPGTVERKGYTHRCRRKRPGPQPSTFTPNVDCGSDHVIIINCDQAVPAASWTRSITYHQAAGSAA